MSTSTSTTTRDPVTSGPRALSYAWLIAGQVAMTVVIQLAPMVGLPVTGYAVYSAVYLGYAACIAITYATVSDVWARALRRSAEEARLIRAFQAALTAVATLGGGVVGTVFLLAARDPLATAVAAAATATAVYRSGVAYRLVAAGRIRRVGIADLAGAGSAASGTAIAIAGNEYSTVLALACWGIGSLVSCAVLAVPPVWNGRATASWFTEHRKDIALLSGEAAIKTLESVGTPYLVGGVGGVLALALHRAASSLTYPVRLVVDVLRSRIISGAIGRIGHAVLAMCVLGALAGAAVGGGLTVLGGWHALGRDTVVVLMAPHAIAVGAWVWSTAISSFIQFVGRGSFSGRRLILRRVAHTVLVIGLTVGGVLMFGPGAVIWSAALAELLAALLWIPPRGSDGRTPVTPAAS